jgi:hypothetical protein
MARTKTVSGNYVTAWKYLLGLKTTKLLMVGVAAYYAYPYVKKALADFDVDSFAKTVGDKIESIGAFIDRQGDALEHLRDH